jgi:hypothetical protein
MDRALVLLYVKEMHRHTRLEVKVFLECTRLYNQGMLEEIEKTRRLVEEAERAVAEAEEETARSEKALAEAEGNRGGRVATLEETSRRCFDDYGVIPWVGDSGLGPMSNIGLPRCSWPIMSTRVLLVIQMHGCSSREFIIPGALKFVQLGTWELRGTGDPIVLRCMLPAMFIVQ